MSNIPYICLSDNCDVICSSQDKMSYPLKIPDRTSLFTCLRSVDRMRIADFCDGSSSSQCCFFSLTNCEYPYAFAIRDSEEIRFYFTETPFIPKEFFATIDSLKSGNMYVDILTSYSEKLNDNIRECDLVDVDELLRGCIKTLSKIPFLSGTAIVLKSITKSVNTTSALSVSTLVSALVFLLYTLSDNSEIIISSDETVNCLSLCISAKTDLLFENIGLFDCAMLVCTEMGPSLPLVNFASELAYRIGFDLLASAKADGTLTFCLSKRTEDDLVSFKFYDMRNFLAIQYSVVSEFIEKLYSASEKKQN